MDGWMDFLTAELVEPYILLGEQTTCPGHMQTKISYTNMDIEYI